MKKVTKTKKSTKAKTQTQRRKKQRGFTLIELLVVVAIIGILSAIAIPQFAAYRARSYNALVESDARNAASAEEAAFIDNGAYTFTGACTTLPGFALSAGVTCALGGSATAFTVTTSHTQATKGCVWTSNASPNMTCT